MDPLYIVALGAGVIGLLFVVFLVKRIMSEDEGTETMRDIASDIRRGAATFMRREFRILAVFAVILALVQSLFVEPTPWSGIVFLLGTIAAGIAGVIGMTVATRANARTAQAASQQWHRGLKVAFSAGAVMGFSVVSLALLGITLTILISGETYLGLSFAFGSSAVALFLRVGGGMFTKCADVGADLVGKVEQKIPEDDPRNAAVIADNVGDNVGDIAGMGSDLYESYVSAVAAAVVLAVAQPALDLMGLSQEQAILVPLTLAAAGLIVSIIGALFVRPKHVSDDFTKQVAGASRAMNTGVYISNIVMIVVAFVIVHFMLDDFSVFWALISGLVAGYLISLSTEYYTSAAYKPAQNIANSSQSGPALTIIQGMSTGMVSTVIPVLIVALATVLAFVFAGLFGIAIAALGLLVNLAILLSMDCYGPIADNAAGIAEMADMGGHVRERCEALDSVGNTTAALGKGFSIGSAALAALAWLATYFQQAGIEVANLANVDVLAGTLIGAMLPFAFSAMVMGGVSRGAFDVVEEVRRQFKEITGLLEGKAKPEYVKTVDIATKRALKEMLGPGIVVIAVPLLLGFLLGPESVAGLLVGALVTGFMLAIMMANSGGAWDNAKKYIESGVFGGKGSEAHDASVIGDTVGDPFKDTAGPALNILIKLVGKVAVIFAVAFIGIAGL